MTAKTDDPARVAAPCSLHDCLLSALVLLRHIYWRVPKTLVADPRNVSGMLGKAIATLEIVERDMEVPVRRDD